MMADARKPRLRRLLWLSLAVAVVTLSWIGWGELHPNDERALRELVHDRLDDWFPQVMAPREGELGLRPMPTAAAAEPERADTGSATTKHHVRVLLLHGLDEPGMIWDDLVPALAAAGFDTWELRYPNDQGIGRSAAYLAGQWDRLPDDGRVVLIGHSMGGLVAREFIGRWRHPVRGPARIDGAPVAGLIMVGTPNHGSAWARLRVWLELREHFQDVSARRFSLFAGLRDGLGEAKLDLRPNSAFLRDLNARPWPPSVPRLIIGGQLVEPPAGLEAGLDAAAAEVGSAALRERLHAWFDQLGDRLGDGAVSADSLSLPGAPEPLIVNASHRGLLRRSAPDAPEPPGIGPIIEQLRRWSEAGGDGKP